MGFIYKITNNINGKIYVGQTTQPLERRWNNHKVCSRYTDKEKYSNIALYHAMNKYGIENFQIESLEEVADNLLDEREHYWIDYYDSYNSGYNLTLGGEGANRYDHQKIADLWEAGLTLKEISEQTDCCVSQVFNILSASINSTYTPKESKLRSMKRLSKPVNQYDIDGNLICSYPTLVDATKAYNCSRNNITCVCNGRAQSFAGFQWRYANDPPPGKIKLHKRAVAQYSLDGVQIRTFDSISAAAKAVGVTEYAIGAVCNKRGSYQSAGFLWSFVGEDPILPPLVPRNSKPVIQKDLLGNVLAYFASAKIACQQNDVTVSAAAINKCCRHESKTAGGYIWEYVS